MSELSLQDLYRKPNLDIEPESEGPTNEGSVWVRYSDPRYFIRIYPPLSKRRRQRLRGKFKAFLRKERRSLLPC